MTEPSSVYLNGQFLAPGQAKVSAFDSGFIFADGVYEVIPVFGGRAFRQSQHIQRLRNNLEKLNIQITIEDRERDLEVAIRDRNGRPCLWPERLFEPFWSEKGDGLGIGLYHARQLVTGAGGQLRALTPSDDAMTFVVNLPKPL